MEKSWKLTKSGFDARKANHSLALCFNIRRLNSSFEMPGSSAGSNSFFFCSHHEPIMVLIFVYKVRFQLCVAVTRSSTTFGRAAVRTDTMGKVSNYQMMQYYIPQFVKTNPEIYRARLYFHCLFPLRIKN